jgi:DNA-binding CsgD family transcriptional regulator
MHNTTTSLLVTGKTGLTPRELEILYWIGQGKPAKEIGVLLHISPQTAQKHLKNIYRKLDVHNKIEALNKTKWLTASLFSNRN